MLLQAGGDSKHLFFAASVKNDYILDRWFGLSQSAGLVENNGIGRCYSFQKLSSLHGNVMGLGFADGGQNGDRHSQLQCAGEVNHQDSQCFRGISREQPGECGTA